MESDSLLSDLSAEERVDLCMLLLDADPAAHAGLGPWQGSSQRRMLLKIMRHMGVTAETIRELADDLHIDLAPLVERIRGHGER